MKQVEEQQAILEKQEKTFIFHGSRVNITNAEGKSFIPPEFEGKTLVQVIVGAKTQTQMKLDKLLQIYNTVWLGKKPVQKCLQNILHKQMALVRQKNNRLEQDPMQLLQDYEEIKLRSKVDDLSNFRFWIMEQTKPIKLHDGTQVDLAKEHYQDEALLSVLVNRLLEEAKLHRTQMDKQLQYPQNRIRRTRSNLLKMTKQIHKVSKKCLTIKQAQHNILFTKVLEF